mmetsp:Transcript_9117/g.22328  ORF Transcript_9117/g.22328 Transcript_9117/m.22328 type:complete len:229 (-) Transcript_9117:2217-2903(-)
MAVAGAKQGRGVLIHQNQVHQVQIPATARVVQNPVPRVVGRARVRDYRISAVEEQQHAVHVAAAAGEEQRRLPLNVAEVHRHAARAPVLGRRLALRRVALLQLAFQFQFRLGLSHPPLVLFPYELPVGNRFDRLDLPPVSALQLRLRSRTLVLEHLPPSDHLLRHLLHDIRDGVVENKIQEVAKNLPVALLAGEMHRGVVIAVTLGHVRENAGEQLDIVERTHDHGVV